MKVKSYMLLKRKICPLASEVQLLPDLCSQQEEADTKVFLVACMLQNYDTYLIRSTDSDVLFVACVNQSEIYSKNIVIQYNTENSPSKYVVCQDLIQAIHDDTDPLMSLCKNQGKSLTEIFGILCDRK